MVSFCGDAPVTNVTLGEEVVNKTECYIDLTLVVINSLFILLSICIILHLSLKRKKSATERYIVRFQEHSSRWILTFCLFMSTLMELGESIVVLESYTTYEKPLHLLITSILSLLACVVTIVYYSKVEFANKPKFLIVLLIYWPAVCLVSTGKLVKLYSMGLNVEHLKIQLTWAHIVLYSLLGGIEVSLLVFQKYLWPKAEEDVSVKHDVTRLKYIHHFTTLFSKATFSWLLPLLRDGRKNPLEMEDLGDLPEADQAENQFKRFYHIYFKEKLAAEKAGKVVSLWKCYWLTFWKTLALGGMMKMVGDLVGLVGPMAINIIVLYAAAIQEGTLSKPDPTKRYHPTTWEFLKNGYVTSVVVLVATFMQSTFSNNFNHLAITEGVHLRSALQCLVYKKALKISGIAGIDTGTVVNHMSVDAFNMMMLFSMGHYIWAVPFKITLLLMLLYMQLGYSALIGAATIYVLAPVQYYICTLLSRIQKEALKVADERLQRTSELLQGIKLLKLYGWETMYGNLIQNVREKELKLLRSDAIYVALNTFLTQASSIVVTLVTFALYSTIEGKPLASSEVFTGLALFNQLTVPLYIIPFVIPIVINAMVSTKRLRHFLQMSEVDSNTPWREQEGPAAIVEYNPDSGSVLLNVKDAELERKRNILGGSDESDGVFLPELMNQPTVDGSVAAVVQNGSFTWDFNSSISVLQDIHVQIPAGKLTVVIGQVGCGKTSLLSALLGEMQTCKGVVQWAGTPSVAYVPQKAWLLNATLKENILFGQPYDGRRYHQVVQACALQPDIELLPARDLTEIGERGVNLSGGQKQRIALARAFYSQARIVILDDPLSALDAHVGRHVFEHGIKTLLLRRSRTVIMVTHRMECLPFAAKILLLEKGRIKHQGTLAELENSNSKFFVTYRKAMQKEEKARQNPDDGTARERHKLVRILSKQTLYRTASTQEIRPRPRLVSLSRQMSHDPSSPLPCHDWGDYDDPLPPVLDPEDPATGRPKYNRMQSSDSTRSHGSGSIHLRHSWRRPPSRLNSKISVRTSEDLIEEEDEEQESKDDVPDALNGKLVTVEERERGKIAKRLYISYMKACRLPLAIGVILLIIVTQAIRVGTDFWLSKWTKNSESRNDTTLWNTDVQYYMVGYAALSGVSIILSLITNLAAQLTSLMAERTLHASMLNNIVRCPMRFFDTTPVGRILNRFSTDMNTIDKKLPVTLPILLRFLLLCISAIVVDVIVNPMFIFAVFPIVGVYYYLQHFFRFTSRELQRLDSVTKSPIFSHFSETLNGLSTIRAFRDEKRFFEILTNFINTNNLAFLMVNCANCWLGIALDYLGGIILFIATVSTLTIAIYGYVTPAFLGLALNYTLLVPIYLNWVVRNMASVEMYMSAVERVDGYSRLPTESYGEEDAAVSQDWPASGEVTFENVTLSYDDDLDPVVRNVTLNIKPGEKVGICGRTGSGKSSLVMGLFRLLNISDGKIRIDGVNVTDIPLSTLRTKLSIIPQDAVMFSGTVRENLDPGNVHTDEELWKALETAQMKDLVISFSEGLDSLVLEEGANFSTGQRQLFCLARALLRQSRIIVLDEATSSLDRETDKALQTVVASSWVGCTVLAIAHRVTSILDFDNVVVLEAGRIVEKGSPKDLLAKRGGTFASLLRACQQQS